MIARGTGVIAIAIGSLLFVAPHSPADAASTARSASGQRATAASRTAHKAPATPRARTARRAAYAGGGLQCVPYARQVSGIQITGNAHTWWVQAKGVYARGERPEPGAVMSFPAIGRMALGHVAVVTRVIGAREVLVDHANWAGPGMRKGMVARGISVIDVSPANDWSAVRVGMPGGSYGSSVYPLNGFIYARADRPGAGTAFAAAAPGQPAARPLAATSGAARGSAATATARALAGEAVPFEEIAEAQAPPSGPAAPGPRRRR